MLNLNHLRYFHVAAQYKSVTKAAEHLSISQPSLSQQLTIFEESLGLNLYYRSGRNFELTPDGKALYEKTQGLFANIDDITHFLSRREKHSKESYSLAVSDDIERPLISDIVGKLVSLKVSEGVKYEIISKPQEEIVREYNENLHDLLITGSPLRRIEPAHVFEFPVKLITSKNNEVLHRLNSSQIKPLFAGLGEMLVLPAESMALRTEIEHLLTNSKVDYKIAFESNILSCVSRAIKQGVGCGFLPTIYVYEDLKHNNLTALGPAKGFWQHKVYVYSKKKISDDVKLQKIILVMQGLND